MYNEADCIRENIDKLINVLDSLGVRWEYLLIDDGSTDDSKAIAQGAFSDHPNCRVIHYSPNKGRGYALQQGFAAATGNYIITTEADLSWGENIISELYQALIRTGDDIIIASTYLSARGYKNVPIFRRKLSLYGNKILRRCFGGELTMFSGMTRGYRRQAIQSIYLMENEKHIHLEIISKAHHLEYRLSEIPGEIYWSPEKSNQSFAKLFGISKHVLPHILSSMTEGALKVIVTVSTFLLLTGTTLIIFGTLNKLLMITAVPKPNLITYGFSLITLGCISFLIALLSLQIMDIKKHIVHLQSQIIKIPKKKISQLPD